MANAIRISHDGAGANNFRLQSTNISIEHDRSPIASPLPGGNPLLIDLGQWRVNITIEGICSLSGINRSDGAISIADRDDIENMANPTVANPWYSRIITLEDSTVVSAVETYRVKISRIRLEKKDANEFYTFSIQLTGYKIV